jgi:hypothetical protein
MVALLCFSLVLLASPAENAALRHQLMVLQRKVRGRVHFTNSDRLFFIHLYRWFPSVLKAMMIIRPETLVRWHHAGLCRYWRWKSRSAGGRPQIQAELRALIWRMSVDNRLWGAPRIHGELLKARLCGGSVDRRQVHGQERRAVWSELGAPSTAGKPRWRQDTPGTLT